MLRRMRGERERREGKGEDEEAWQASPESCDLVESFRSTFRLDCLRLSVLGAFSPS